MTDSVLSNGTSEATSTSTKEVVYEFSRAAMLDGWWTWAAIVGILSILVYLSVRLYLRDTTELTAGVRRTLMLLRLITIASIVFFFFGLQRRTQQRVTRTSEVAILVDTSQSMSLPSSSTPGAESQSRSARVASILEDPKLLSSMEKSHRVTVYRFDDGAEPEELETRGTLPNADSSQSNLENSESATVSKVGIFGALCLTGMSLLLLASFVLALGGRADAIGGPLFSAAILLVLGAVLMGGAWTVETNRSLASLIGLNAVEPTAEKPAQASLENESEQASPRRSVDWNSALSASGSESRIGDAVRAVLQRHDPSTLAGVLLVTDGQGNGGISSTAAATLARRSEVAIYPVGVGSSDAPLNLRIVDLDAPRRVYPGDKFSVAAVVQGSGTGTIKATMQLLDGIEEADSSKLEVIDSREIEVKSDGTLSSIRFEMNPESIGRRRLSVRLQLSEGSDQNQEDNAREARYEVVARKLRVLTIAGGPTREYQFVRNMLFRDESIEVDAWLQTGQPGMSQDADRLLSEFPATADELFEYDAIVAFDPDWMAIPLDRLALLERWLGEQAGGLILIGGPIYMPQWTRLRTDPRVTILAGMYPVELATRSPLLSGGREGGDTSFRLEFTPEAQRAEFLFIADDPKSSFEAWNEFGGVYDYVGVKDAKPGSKVYAYFSDPTSKVGDALPVYLASQFYGAGRTFFQGSGEMWRLRGIGDAYFDSYYTKLVRWVSEGRLLRDSNRGVLLVDNARAGLGDTITVRAVLTDEQFEPLRVASVDANLLKPDGSVEVVKLAPIPGETREGTYGGRFVVRAAGSYELRLTLGDSLGEQVLRQSIQVRLPTIELERPKRNDEDLAFIATTTGGQYLPIGNEGDDDMANVVKLVESIRPQPQTTVLPGTPDGDFTLRRNATLLWLIATALAFEWILRRLQRLA